MPLKISLKPNEKMVVGGAVLRNGSTKTEFYIENTVPVLRQKDILSETEADSICRRIYFTIQLMYIDGDHLAVHQRAYWQAVRLLVDSAPSAVVLVDRVSSQILNGEYYQALKQARKLIEFEKEVLTRVS